MAKKSSFNNYVSDYFDRNSSGRADLVAGDSFNSLGFKQKKTDVLELVEHHALRLKSDTDSLKICDVGCNDGAFIEYLLGIQAEIDLYGVDVSRKALAKAKANSNLDKVSFDLVDGESGDLPFADETFDIITSIEVIEHVEDKDKMLSEIYRILKPGGVVVLTTPNKESVALNLQVFLVGFIRYCFGKKGHKDIFIDEKGFEELYKKVGFLCEKKDILYWIRPYLTISYSTYTLGLLLPFMLPVPSIFLLYYQRMLNKYFGRFFKTRLITRFFCWSIFVVLRK